MNDDIIGADEPGLAVLYESSTPGAVHRIRYYLYFPNEEIAGMAVQEICRLGLSSIDRKGALGPDWLVLASQDAVPTETHFVEMRERFENLVSRLGGEYDGWEAEII